MPHTTHFPKAFPTGSRPVCEVHPMTRFSIFGPAFKMPKWPVTTGSHGNDESSGCRCWPLRGSVFEASSRMCRPGRVITE